MKQLFIWSLFIILMFGTVLAISWVPGDGICDTEWGETVEHSPADCCPVYCPCDTYCPVNCTAADCEALGYILPGDCPECTGGSSSSCPPCDCLLEIIRAFDGAGYSDDEIRSALETAGYTSAEIEAALGNGTYGLGDTSLDTKWLWVILAIAVFIYYLYKKDKKKKRKK